MSKANRYFRASGWPQWLEPVATSAVAKENTEDAANAEQVDTGSTEQSGSSDETVDVVLRPELRASAYEMAARFTPSATNPVKLTPPPEKPFYVEIVTELLTFVLRVFRGVFLPRRREDSEPKPPFFRRWFYTIFFFIAMLVIWFPVMSYVFKAAPVYTSEWTILIPGTQVGASVDLVNLGEANTDVKTPYGGSSFSPGVNYKMIMSSVSVLAAAAESLDMTLEEFGTPKINVTDQAATLAVVFSSDSAQGAKDKSQAIYTAFQNKLTELRKDEVNSRRAGSNEQLEEYAKQADIAREALAKFRKNSSVVSLEQYQSLVGAASDLEQNLIQLRVKRDGAARQLESLATLLEVDSDQAADFMVLRRDRLVQVLSGEYARLQASYIEQAAILGSRHPKVVHAQSKASAAKQSVLNRVTELVGDVDADELLNFLPDPSADDGQVFKELVSFSVERDMLTQELESSEMLLEQLRERIAIAGTDLDTLEDLERNHDIATTILVSATANLDLGRSNIYATYPLTQLLVEPTLPEKPKRLLKLLAIVGALIGTLLVVIGILVVKYRERWRRLILKNA
jgi:uncharacterized protein involved in exopolysaccharide biosynthesis